MNRYETQMRLPDVGEIGQERLSNATVTVIGAGGLGSTVLPLLVGAGVGTVVIVDPDTVEVGNLHRQTLYRMDDVGSPKAQTAAYTLSALNPDCTIVPVVDRLSPATARELAQQSDVLIDAADNFAVTYLLSDVCHEYNRPLVAASVVGRAGHVGGFCGGAPTYRAIFSDLPSEIENCSTAGVLGPAVATLGAIQAQMTLSLLLGHSPSPLGLMLSIDLVQWRVSEFRFDNAPDPVDLSPSIVSVGDMKDSDIVVDLRYDPVPTISQLSPQPNQRVVFVCVSGFRAWHAARNLREQGHHNVSICAVGN